MGRKTYQNLILATCVTSALAAIIGMVSLGTEDWVSAECNIAGSSSQNGVVNYGLFSGTYERYVVTTDFYQITITCNSEEQACAMLCGGTPESREAQLKRLIQNDDSLIFDGSCPKINRNIKLADPPESAIPHPRKTGEYTFIDYIIYASTVGFLVLSVVVGVVAVGLSVWNTIGNPIYSVFNVMGIIGLNSVAAICAMLTMILWGVQYNITLIDNVGVLDTIKGEMQTLNPALGYSFWINLGSILLYCSSIGLIICRKILLDKEPEATNIEVMRADDRTLVLF